MNLLISTGFYNSVFEMVSDLQVDPFLISGAYAWVQYPLPPPTKM